MSSFICNGFPIYQSPISDILHFAVPLQSLRTKLIAVSTTFSSRILTLFPFAFRFPTMSSSTSYMCFKVGKYLTTKRYDEFMKSLAWELSDKSTNIKFQIVFTDTMATVETTLTPPEICEQIDRVVDTCRNMPKDLKAHIISDYLRWEAGRHANC
jgi:hypothetical protein